jgi:hypothetical protein
MLTLQLALASGTRLTRQDVTVATAAKAHTRAATMDFRTLADHPGRPLEMG